MLKLNRFVQGLIRPWLVKLDAWNNAQYTKNYVAEKAKVAAEAKIVADAKAAKAFAAGLVTVECERDSLCMADDVDAPNSSTFLVPSSAPLVTDPIALGQMLSSDYLPHGAGTGLIWELQLNGVKFARVTNVSEGVRLVEPLVTKCQLLLDKSNTVKCVIPRKLRANGSW
jgi:hypothetical protein